MMMMMMTTMMKIMMMMMIIIIIIIVQFSSLVLKCSLSCTNTNYKASITTQIEHKKYKYAIMIII